MTVKHGFHLVNQIINVKVSVNFVLWQMRYYDAIEDSHCKGYIELKEVESVQAVKIIPGAPKKAEENSFIEVGMVYRHSLYCDLTSF